MMAEHTGEGYESLCVSIVTHYVETCGEFLKGHNQIKVSSGIYVYGLCPTHLASCFFLPCCRVANAIIHGPGW